MTALQQTLELPKDAAEQPFAGSFCSAELPELTDPQQVADELREDNSMQTCKVAAQTIEDMLRALRAAWFAMDKVAPEGPDEIIEWQNAYAHLLGGPCEGPFDLLPNTQAEPHP